MKEDVLNAVVGDLVTLWINGNHTSVIASLKAKPKLVGIIMAFRMCEWGQLNVEERIALRKRLELELLDR